MNPSQNTLPPDVEWARPEKQDLFDLLRERRGWTDEYLRAIENDAHDRLLDLDRLVDKLETVRLENGVITIAPDFDMDGISSGVLGYAGLSELGFHVNLHLPDYRRGHDLTENDITEIAQNYPDTSVLLTCDGGINSNRGIARAQALGWFTIVTDHHQELEPGSVADIAVNPCRIDETYSLKGICGAHVLYQVLEAYAQRYQPTKMWQIRLLRLFAGLGTVSDVMPMLYENRQLVRDSLSIARLLHVPAPDQPEPNRFGRYDPDPDAIEIGRSTLLTLLHGETHHPAFVTAFEGFALVLKAFAQHGKLRDIDDLDEGFYGFYLAPTMNSPRRTGSALEPCFTAFIAQDDKVQLAALHEVIENNEHRKQMVEVHLVELQEGDQPLAPWVYFSEAYPGMYGLLANTMMQRFGHPVVVLNRPLRSDEFVSGSARAPEWFDVIQTLDPIDGMRAVGHAQACGVKVDQAQSLTTLARALEDATRIAQLLQGAAPERAGDLVLGSGPDADASLAETDRLMDLVDRITLLKPFGPAFSEPLFDVRLPSGGFRVERMGSSKNCPHPHEPEHGEENRWGDWVCNSCKRHLRLITRTGVAVLWWNAADEHGDRLTRIGEGKTPGGLRVIAKLQTNTFLGETRLQVVVDEEVLG